MSQGTRVNETDFIVAQFTFLGLAILAAGFKIALRLRTTKSLSLDDILLLIAVILLSATVAIFYHALPLIYEIFSPGAMFEPKRMLKFTKLVDATAVLTWTAIFTVKISFVLFFRPLVDRIRRVKIWWMVVLAIVLACAPVNMFMTFYICSDFSLNLDVCYPGIDQRQAVYLNLTAALDILTDLLILSIPITLLWKVQIDLRRKLALAVVLCLSSFMIAIAIVRVSFAYTSPHAMTDSPVHEGQPSSGEGQTGPDGQPRKPMNLDQSWMFFWLNMEAAIAIIMVALTAFRSMLGRMAAEKAAYKASYELRNTAGASASRSGGDNSGRKMMAKASISGYSPIDDDLDSGIELPKKVAAGHRRDFDLEKGRVGRKETWDSGNRYRSEDNGALGVRR